MEFVFQAVDVGGEFRDVVEDGGGPGGFLSCGLCSPWWN